MIKQHLTLSDESIDKLAQAIAFYSKQPEPLVNTADLARIVGVSIATVNRWKANAKRTGFPYYQDESILRFLVSEVQEWMRRN